MKAIAANAFLATLSIALTLAAVEVGLRVAGYPPAQTDHSEFMRRDPALGWALRPGVTGTYVSDEYTHDVRVNSRGMRGPEPPAGAGEVRIVLLGDSFVEGYSVAEEERVSEALEARLRAVGGCEVRVVPMGTAGYSTDQQLIWLERDGLSVEPHAVVPDVLLQRRLVQRTRDLLRRRQAVLPAARRFPGRTLPPDAGPTRRAGRCRGRG